MHNARETIHPRWLRTTHWINALSVVILTMSGWQIYNAAPFFDLYFPKAITLGGWLGGALQWHFAAMWLLAANGLIYLACNVASGRLRSQFFPLSVKAVLTDFMAALRGRLSHTDPRHYNAVQRAAYAGVICVIVVLVLSGLAIWKPVQFQGLASLMGGFEGARWVHFIAMALVVLFVAVHVAMVALVPRTLLPMFTGRASQTGQGG